MLTALLVIVALFLLAIGCVVAISVFSYVRRANTITRANDNLRDALISSREATVRNNERKTS